MPNSPTPPAAHAPVGTPGEVLGQPTPLPVNPTPPPKSEVELLREQVQHLTQTLAPLTSPGFTLPQQPRPNTGQQVQIDPSAVLTTGQKVWKAGRWAGGAVAVIFMGGMAWAQFVDGNALDSEVDAAVETVQVDVSKNAADIEKNKGDIGTVKSGVDTLVQRSSAEKKVEQAQRVVDKYQAEYDIKVAEYTAAKAAGKRAKQPTKDPAHIDAEVKLERAVDALAKVD